MRSYIQQTVKAQALDAVRQAGVVFAGDVDFQKLAQVAVLQVLHYHAEGLVLATDAQHPRYVVVVQGGQYSDVSVEVFSVRKGICVLISLMSM